MNRLFEIVYLLVNRKCITANELATHFEVSVRTIYRDIEALSIAGIPVYATKGKGGGIHIMEDYVLNNSLLTNQEQNQILAALQSLGAVSDMEVEPVLTKLSSIFNRKMVDWIDVDFSSWSNRLEEKEKFNILKEAILNRKEIRFQYFNSYGRESSRNVEPLKLIFRGQAWYIYAFCKEKQDYRFFKITRILGLELGENNFEREIPSQIYEKEEQDYQIPLQRLVLKIDSRMAYRIYDEFESSNIKWQEDGSCIVEADMPYDRWVIGTIMSYGDAIEVLEPITLREEIKRIYQKALMKYDSE
ncbi:MAG TPA: YafY family protein [Lachnospiraceae bacterium]|nr:YafY family protein [Lachnospiraceae bacterium]